MDFKSRLQKMQQQASEQMADYVPGGNFAPVPDADYSLRVKVTLDETRKDPKRVQLGWCFVVADGEYEGRQIWDRTIIEDNKTGLQIARGRVEDLGYEWPEDDLGALVDIVDDITTRCPLITARVKTTEDGEYTNTRIRIREVLELPDGGGADVPSDDQPADEAPVDEAPANEAPVDADAEILQALLNLCAAQGIDGITDDMSIADIVDGLTAGEVQFKTSELSEEELAFLEELAPALIERPAPAPRKALGKAAPAKAAPAAAPAPAKAPAKAAPARAAVKAPPSKAAPAASVKGAKRAR